MRNDLARLIKPRLNTLYLKVKVAIAYFSFLIFTRSDGRFILVGEKSGSQCQDNAFIFFAYLYDTGRRDIFFVANSETIKDPRLARFGRNVVRYLSIRHCFKIFRAKILLINDGFLDVYPPVSGILEKTSTPFIYLQHGILRYKTIHLNPAHYMGRIMGLVVSLDDEFQIAASRLSSKEDVFEMRRLDFIRHLLGLASPLTSKQGIEEFASALELYKDILPDTPYHLSSIASDYRNRARALARRIGFPAGRIIESGLPRHDRLKKLIELSEHQDRKTVFIFLTWRDYWKQSAGLASSPLYEMLRSILESPGFTETVERLGLIIEVHLHHKLGAFERELRKELDGKNVIFHKGDLDMQSAMTRSAALITDYSSVSIDFAIAGVPVIFYQPDAERFYHSRGNYVDERSSWVGPVVARHEEIGTQLRRVVESGRNPNTSSLLASYPQFGNSNAQLAKRISQLKPSVLFVAYNIYGTGGTVRSVTNLANHLYSQGYQVQIISLRRHQKTPDMGLHPNIQVFTIQDDTVRGRRPLWKKVLGRIPSIAFHPDSDLYHRLNLFIDIKFALRIRASTTDVIVPTFPGMVPLIRYLARSNTRVLVQEHKFFEAYSARLQSLIRRHYGALSGVVAVTEADATGYTSIAKKTYVAPNGVSGPDILPEKNEIPRIIGLGRLDAQKQFDLLLRAFDIAAEEFPEWTLTIFGDGPDKGRLLEVAASLKHGDRVEFPGITRNSISEIARSEICAVTSEYEGFGLVYIEAYAARTPIVTFDIERGPKEIVIDGVTGLKAQPFNVGDYAIKLQELMASRELRKKLANAGRELYESKFNSHVVGQRFEEILADLAQKTS